MATAYPSDGRPDRSCGVDPTEWQRLLAEAERLVRTVRTGLDELREAPYGRTPEGRPRTKRDLRREARARAALDAVRREADGWGAY